MALSEIRDGIGWIGREKVRSYLAPDIVRRADELQAELNAIPVPRRTRGIRPLFISLDLSRSEDFDQRRERLLREAQAERRAILKDQLAVAELEVLRDFYARLSDGRILAFGYANEIRMGEPRRAVPADYWTTPSRRGLWIEDFSSDIAERPGLKVFGLRFLTAAEAAAIEAEQLISAADAQAIPGKRPREVIEHWELMHGKRHPNVGGKKRARLVVETPGYRDALLRVSKSPDALEVARDALRNIDPRVKKIKESRLDADRAKRSRGIAGNVTRLPTRSGE